MASAFSKGGILSKFFGIPNLGCKLRPYSTVLIMCTDLKMNSYVNTQSASQSDQVGLQINPRREV